MESIAHPLTFMAGCLPRTPFRAIVEAASAAGFEAITIWPNVWRHAMRKEGLSLAGMRAMLEDHNLRLTDADSCRDWVPAASPDATAFGPQKSDIPRREFFEICSGLGGTTIVAVHLTDAGLVMDREIEGFARLCDDAAAFGLRIALEFVAFGDVADVTTALRIVNGAGRRNGGLVVDIGHHVRGGGDDDALRKVPAEKIFTVQLLDGPRRARYSPLDEAMYHRQLPGDGEFDVPGFLRLLGEIGVRAATGPEVYRPDFETRAPLEVARALLAATRRMLAQAGTASA